MNQAQPEVGHIACGMQQQMQHERSLAGISIESRPGGARPDSVGDVQLPRGQTLGDMVMKLDLQGSVRSLAPRRIADTPATRWWGLEYPVLPNVSDFPQAESLEQLAHLRRGMRRHQQVEVGHWTLPDAVDAQGMQRRTLQCHEG